MRAPLQVIVFPYVLAQGELPLYAIFRRSDDPSVWQAIAGGGEDDETPLETARRETFEEAGIDPKAEFTVLDSMATIPVEFVSGFEWGPQVLVIPQYSFGVDATRHEIRLSEEHTEFEWSSYGAAISKLTYESNRLALWELNHRLVTGSD